MSEMNPSTSTENPIVSPSTPSDQVSTENNSNTAQTPVFTGHCFCQAITFTLLSLPIKSYLCHCLDCRRLTGTSFAHNIAFPFSSLTVSTRSDGQNSDTSAAKVDVNDILATFGTPESGRRQFCGKCGTGLFLFAKVQPGEKCERVIVQAGAIDGSHEDERLRPVEEGFCKRREAWMPDMNGTRVIEERRSAGLLSET